MPFSGPPLARLGESCALVLNGAMARRDEQSPSRLRSQPPQLPSLASGAVEKRSPSQAFAPPEVGAHCLPWQRRSRLPSLASGSTPPLTGFPAVLSLRRAPVPPTRQQLTATAIPPVFASNMGDDDYLENWETVVLEPLDTASGVVPAWLEAALSAEAAGCPLHPPRMPGPLPPLQ